MKKPKFNLQKIPPMEPGEEPATENQLGFLRTMVNITETELRSLGKRQAARLIDEVTVHSDRMRQRKSAGTRFRLGAAVVGLLVLFAVWKGWSLISASIDESAARNAANLKASREPGNPVAPSASGPSAERPSAAAKPADPAPPGTNPRSVPLATLEGVPLPVSLITTGDFSLRNAAGKEIAIPTRTGIRVTNRSGSGTLTMEINGLLYVGNEARLSGKVRKKD